MGKILHRDGSFGPPHNDSRSSGTEPESHPEKIFHVYLLLPYPGLDAGRRRLRLMGRGDFSVFAEAGGTATLNGMDSVRFGRALGVGARAAAKTLVTAVDAATSPNSSSAKSSGSSQRASESPRASVAGQVTRTAAQAKRTTEGVARGGKQFGEAVWRPFVRLSGVLWLEFTGVFFGIFALYAGSGAWKMRGDLVETAQNHDAHLHFLLAAGMAVVFAYFCVSSFLRARRRERGRETR